jgi:hypothetical protein
MHPPRQIIPLFVALSAVALVGAAIPAGAPARRVPGVRPAFAEVGEVARVRAHFDSVLMELRKRDVSSLSAAQRSSRAAVLLTLAAYRERGVFPHNYDFPGRLVPYLVDRKTGTLCAVAHLLESTGRRDIVDRVALADNNVRVPQLAGDTAFATWLDDQGLTLAEAARIQVPYASRPSFDPAYIGVAATSMLGLTGSVVGTLWNSTENADGHHTVATKLGLVSGIATVVGGLVTASMAGKPALVLIFVPPGTMSTVISASALHRHREVVAAERDAQRHEAARAVIAPFIAADHKPSAGLALSLRF